MFLRFEGAYTNNTERQSLRVQIEASGPFANRRAGKEFDFVTRAMAGMVYQYELDTGKFDISSEKMRVQHQMVLHIVKSWCPIS